MRAWSALWTMLAVAACGRSERPAPTVLGTLLCEPRIEMLGASAELPDPVAATEALKHDVVAQVTDAAFLRRVAAEEGVDAAVVARAVTARPARDSRLVEIGVAIADRALATRVCDAVLEHAVSERLGGEVRVLDHCAP